MKKLMLFVFILTIALNAYAGKPGGDGNATDLPVTTEISDTDALNNLYDLQSDGFGSYLHGVNGDVSILMVNGYNRMTHGDWLLDLANVRTVKATLSASNAVMPGDPGYQTPATLLGTFNNSARLQTPCTRGLKNMLTMNAGDAFTCAMLIRFLPMDGTANYYQLNMRFADYPENQEVQISCNSIDSGGCNDWFIDPIPVVLPGGGTTPGKTRARLEYINTKGKGSITNKGAFYLRFHIHVTRP